MNGFLFLSGATNVMMIANALCLKTKTNGKLIISVNPNVNMDEISIALVGNANG